MSPRTANKTRTPSSRPSTAAITLPVNRGWVWTVADALPALARIVGVTTLGVADCRVENLARAGGGWVRLSAGLTSDHR
jgi:hypothetical protein